MYDYLCHVCDTQEQHFVHKREDEVTCEKCGEPKHRLFNTKLGPINFGWPEDGITLEHVGPEPVHFNTRKEAKEYAKKHDLQLGCL